MGTEEIEDEVLMKFRNFKNFDVVTDASDHHYFKSSKPKHKFKASNTTVKRITQEWTILEKSLPDSIFVRVYEDTIDLMRAVIIGTEGTPYHNGLFFFDILFPPNYPSRPPKLYFHSHGLRLNPNLYADGKICLSLLNTWTGSSRESWIPSESTVLQVLVSIQALVLNAKPYFNEPGYEIWARLFSGEKNSLAYNNNVFKLSCMIMLQSLKNPPKHFEDLVKGQFREAAQSILNGCNEFKRNGADLDDVKAMLVSAFENNGSYLIRSSEEIDDKQGESESGINCDQGGEDAKDVNGSTEEDTKIVRGGFLRSAWKKLMKRMKFW